MEAQQQIQYFVKGKGRRLEQKGGKCEKKNNEYYVQYKFPIIKM